MWSIFSFRKLYKGTLQKFSDPISEQIFKRWTWPGIFSRNQWPVELLLPCCLGSHYSAKARSLHSLVDKSLVGQHFLECRKNLDDTVSEWSMECLLIDFFTAHYSTKKVVTTVKVTSTVSRFVVFPVLMNQNHYCYEVRTETVLESSSHPRVQIERKLSKFVQLDTKIRAFAQRAFLNPKICLSLDHAELLHQWAGGKISVHWGKCRETTLEGVQRFGPHLKSKIFYRPDRVKIQIFISHIPNLLLYKQSAPPYRNF